MRKYLLLAAASAVATMSVPAAATVTVNATSLDAYDVTNGATSSTIAFGDSGLAANFTEWLTFTNDMAGMYNITLGTASGDVDFTSAFLTSGSRTTPLGPTLATLTRRYSDTSEFWDVIGVPLASGQYTLNINGVNRGVGTLSGTVAINQMPAVPEPSTWAMMLIGFGAVGFGLRRRKGEGTKARVRVTYA